MEETGAERSLRTAGRPHAPIAAMSNECRRVARSRHPHVAALTREQDVAPTCRTYLVHRFPDDRLLEVIPGGWTAVRIAADSRRWRAALHTTPVARGLQPSRRTRSYTARSDAEKQQKITSRIDVSRVCSRTVDTASGAAHSMGYP